jgi:pimeloyl-ACP methyl ester carboxylesterase
MDSTLETAPIDVAGPDDALPIVFIHGATATRKMWHPQMEDLSYDFRVVAVDLPGHGALREQRFHLQAAMQEIASAIDRETRGQALIVGLSLGGYVAMAFAQRYPEMARGLILSGCSVNYPLWLTLMAKMNSEFIIHVYGERTFVSLLELSFRWMFPRVTATQISSGFHPNAWGDAMMEIGQRDFSARLRSFPGAVMILNGEYDTVNRSSEKTFAAAPRNGSLQIIRNAGHICNLDQPEVFNKAVRNFARSLDTL